MGNVLGITNTMIFALGFIFTVYLARRSGKI